MKMAVYNSYGDKHYEVYPGDIARLAIWNDDNEITVTALIIAVIKKRNNRNILYAKHHTILYLLYKGRLVLVNEYDIFNAKLLIAPDVTSRAWEEDPS